MRCAGLALKRRGGHARREYRALCTWQRAIIGLHPTDLRNPSYSLLLRFPFSSMPPLPLELIEEIVDIVAECSPESLTDCALVSRSWTPRSKYHIDRIFRTPTVSTFNALHTFLAIVQKHPRLAALATSLVVVPVPALKSGSGSYVPFHHLASHVLPNVRHLVLEETLRWSDYPLLYREGTVGFSFCSVIALDISCHFNSIWDLFSVIQSFRNVQDVRLIYPHHTPPPWMVREQIHPPQRKPFSRRTFKLQNLELPVRNRSLSCTKCL